MRKEERREGKGDERSGLEPAVKDLLDSLEDGSRVLLRGDGDRVDVVSI
jgi:hypothetical protein